MATRNKDKIAAIEEVLGMMDEIATILRSLHDRRIEAYCLAAFEGRNGGWLGEFERDILEAELESARDDEDEVDE